MAFKAVLRKEIAFFDDESNRVGALTSRLSNDPASVQGATGQKIGYSVDAAMTVLGGLIIAFMFGWKLTFTILAFMPLMFLNGIFVGRVTRGFAQGDRADSEKSSHIATEAISNIRTVAQLTMEDKLLEKYSAIYQEHYGSNVKRAYILGALTGMSQGIMYYIYPTCFIAGALFVKNGEMEFYNVIRIFLVLNVGGMKAGRTAVASPEYSKAKLAAARLLELFHEEPKIDSASTSGESLSTCNGNIHLRNVTFQYPSRPKVDVFLNLNLSVNSGETVALVGASGGGKSTVTQLVERFYDVPEGGIFLDGKNIKMLNVQYLRSQVGIVSQEPTLFDCTIRENIEYGDNSRDVALPEIIAAARDANIHSFISTLPLGYETRVGDHGTQLSGGQKQRIAIARALLGNPKLLLLDEATSALDSESEKVVQEALDRARVGRACIVIAHRLSTIQNADKIAVIQDRRVSEQGTHMELMALKGQYYKLQLAQSRVIES